MTTEYNDANTSLTPGMYNDSATPDTPRTLYQNLGIQDPSLQSQSVPRFNNQPRDNTFMLGSKTDQVTPESLLERSGNGGTFNQRHFATYAGIANQMNRTANDMTKANMSNAIAQDRNDIAWDRNNIETAGIMDKLGSTESAYDKYSKKYGLGNTGSGLIYNNQVNSPKPE